MKRIPDEKQFKLKQVKYIESNGALEFKAELELTEGDSVYKPTLNDKYPIIPHKDLTDLLIELKRPLATVHGLIDFETVVSSKEFKATDKQLDAAAMHTKSKLFDVNVTGIAISGQDGNRGLVITGSYGGQAINSKKLKFSSTTYGFEEELEKISDKICHEVYLFVFKDKKAQLDLFEGEPLDGTGE